ncbi:unnamed protein product [Pleuronectes platessa]|uniref:Uncharacterized protein n=1 Tax=Pleuronectes platessa TaxID=8262 RepID=A0A9N7YCQ2_PLEPL|nr:unnamed protein product [Pleuronectes platessa]
MVLPATSEPDELSGVKAFVSGSLADEQTAHRSFLSLLGVAAKFEEDRGGEKKKKKKKKRKKKRGGRKWRGLRISGALYMQAAGGLQKWEGGLLEGARFGRVPGSPMKDHNSSRFTGH